jgi:hypothetical protein
MLQNLNSLSFATAFSPLNFFLYQDVFGDFSKIPGIIFEKVKQFFAHRYADAHLFMGAYSAWSANSRRPYSPETELAVFQRFVSTNSPQRARERFMELPHQVRNRLFAVDAAYMRGYANEIDPERAEVLKDEIIRECEQVRLIDKVILFVDRVVGKLFGRGQMGVTSVVALSSSAALSTIGGGGIDLAIPDTLPYVQGLISPAVQAKADEIVALKTRYDALGAPPPIPPEFSDNILSDAMAMPIFDASHPVVQSGLPALRAAVGGAGASTALNHHRTLRHLIDKENLEAHIGAGSSWAPAKCPHCRHPEHGGIRREYLLIDTGLQDEILHFLRAVPGI